MGKIFKEIQTFFKDYWLLLAIFVLALACRSIYLETLPATFFVDEVLSGYLGRFMLLNGMDLFGNPHPWLYFNKFGDYYIVLPMYLDGLSTFIFGVTRFATRFPTALIGSLAVFPVFGITRAIFRHKSVALLSALLIALLPWHIVLSRTTTESVIELSAIAGVIWCLLLASTHRQIKWLFLAFILSTLSYLIYHTARVLVPLIWLGYIASFFVQLRKNKWFLSITIVATSVLFFTTALISQTDWGRGRFDQTSIFSDQSGVSIRMTEMTYNLGQGSVLLARIFHNKIVGFGREFIGQYFGYFNFSFLFTDQPLLKTRYAVPEVGIVYISLLLMLLSLLFPSKKTYQINRPALWWLVWILLIAPLPAALTFVESPNIRRSILMALPLVMFAAMGWQRSFHIAWRQFKLGYFLTFLLFVEVVLFGYYYVKQSDLYSAFLRSDGMPEVANYIVNLPAQTPVIVTDSIDFPLYYLFAKQNFSASLATQFKPQLRIEQIDSVFPRQEKCAGELPVTVVKSLSPASKVIEPGYCQPDFCRFKTDEVISAVNYLTKYRVLSPLSKPCSVTPPQ